MDRNVEDPLDIHTNPKEVQYWKLEKEEEQEEEEDKEEDEEEYGKAVLSQESGWRVVLAGFVINMLSSLGVNSFAMLFSPQLLEMGVTPGFVASITSVSLAAANLLCLLVTTLLHCWGYRRLLLLGGFVYSGAFILAALAFSTPGPFVVATFIVGSLREGMFLLVQVAVSRSFERHLPLALGVTVAGGPFIQITGPPIIAFMQTHYNPRTVLLILGVIMLQICISALLLPPDMTHGAPVRVDYLAMARRQEVASLWPVIAIINATHAIFWSMVPLLLLDTGHTSHEIVPYLSIPAMANLCSRVSFSLLLCHLCQTGLIIRLVTIVYAVTIPVWYWCERLVWRVAWLSVVAGSSGVVKSLVSLLVLEVVGLKWQAETLCLINLSTGVAILLFGQLTALEQDGIHHILALLLLLKGSQSTVSHLCSKEAMCSRTCTASDLARVVTGSYAPKLYALSGLLIMNQVLWEVLDTQGSNSSSKYHPFTSHYRRKAKRRPRDIENT